MGPLFYVSLELIPEGWLLAAEQHAEGASRRDMRCGTTPPRLRPGRFTTTYFVNFKEELEFAFCFLFSRLYLKGVWPCPAITLVNLNT